MLRLLPEPATGLPIAGLLLDHDLRGTGEAGGGLVYTAFVVSVDGRIAIDQDGDGDLSVPTALSNDRDWRLFQELTVQADAVIVSGRYMRERGEGRGQSVFDYFDNEQLGDLVAWRRSRGLPDRPALVIVSNSLDFDPAVADAMASRIIAVTGSEPAAADRHRLERHGIEIVAAGSETVDGGELVDALADRGHRVVFSAAGSEVFHTLLTAGRLDLVFATQVQRVLGGRRYASLLEQDLAAPHEVSPEAIYLDQGHPGPGGQLITRYRVAG